MQIDRSVLPVSDIQHFDKYRERHRKVDIALRDLDLKGFDHQRDTDQK